MFSIGEFSRITSLTVKALRFYHEKGILVPARVDEDSGYRYYSTDNAARARLIVRLRDLEFSLEEIREILQHTDESDILDTLEARVPGAFGPHPPVPTGRARTATHHRSGTGGTEHHGHGKLRNRGEGFGSATHRGGPHEGPLQRLRQGLREDRQGPGAPHGRASPSACTTMASTVRATRTLRPAFLSETGGRGRWDRRAYFARRTLRCSVAPRALRNFGQVLRAAADARAREGL